VDASAKSYEVKKLTSYKCLQCGRCCQRLILEMDYDDGQDVPEEMIEITRDGVKRMKQRVTESGAIQCIAFKDGKCSIYDRRPRMCREYLCIEHPEHGHLRSPLQRIAEKKGDYIPDIGKEAEHGI